MVIEDILRRKGSDTQCVFLSGEKCLYQAGRSQWLGKQWIVWASNDALGLWGEAGGDWGANCKNTRERSIVLMTHMGVSPNNYTACLTVLSAYLFYHSRLLYTFNRNYFVKYLHLEFSLNTMLSITCFFVSSLPPVYTSRSDSVTQCRDANYPFLWCQCVKCQHGQMHWLSSHMNMPSSCVMVCGAAQCEVKHIKHTHAHVICSCL